MIYPPILNSFQSAFTNILDNYYIGYQLSNLTDFNEIGHVQIRITYQSNMLSIIDNSQFPDGIIYTTEFDKTGVFVKKDWLLLRKWEEDTYYKVQIRFGKQNTLPWLNNLSSFSEWKSEAINTNQFSEWSTVMILKCIYEPTVELLTNGEYIEFSTTPLFYGQYKNKGSEKENLYRFELYSNNILIEDSGWLQHNTLNDNNEAASTDQHRFKTVLKTNQTYQVIYYVQTENYYIASTKPYQFEVQVTSLNALTNVDFYTQVNSEDGCIECYLTSKEPINGNYIIIRSSQDTNYEVQEELFKINLFDEVLNNRLILSDYTVENGKKYKYGIQKEWVSNIRTLPYYENNPIKEAILEHAYIVGDGGHQFKIKFNGSLSSFKHSVLATKQNPIGSKYPFIQRNGIVNYAEFTINGLISFHSDENKKFLTLKNDGYYFDNELIIPIDKFSMENNDSKLIDTNLTQNNYFIEYKFREIVEKFLNNGQYKLYRSPTEGNFIVYLMNVNLTPESNLKGFVYKFSATAYEIDEYNLSNIINYKIVNAGDFNTDNSKITYSFNQISGNFTSKTNLLEKIQNLTNYDTDDDTSYRLIKIVNFNIESLNPQKPYVKFSLNNQIMYTGINKPFYGENYDDIYELTLLEDAEIILNFTYNTEITRTSNGITSLNYKTKQTWNQITMYNKNYDISLLDLIKEKSKEEIAHFCGIDVNELILNDTLGLYVNKNKTIAYTFLNLKNFEIEADVGTQLKIISPENNINLVTIGQTGRFIIDCSEGNIKDIKLTNPCYFSLDFVALTLYANNN